MNHSVLCNFISFSFPFTHPPFTRHHTKHKKKFVSSIGMMMVQFVSLVLLHFSCFEVCFSSAREWEEALRDFQMVQIRADAIRSWERKFSPQRKCLGWIRHVMCCIMMGAVLFRLINRFPALWMFPVAALVFCFFCCAASQWWWWSYVVFTLKYLPFINQAHL